MHAQRACGSITRMESNLIRWVRNKFLPRGPVLVGIGDDAAVLRHERNTVVTTDMLMDGVDFLIDEVAPRRIGRKALAVNLSDIAAMAAKPLAAFVSLCLPQSGGDALARELYEGMATLADEFDCPIAGGDTNSWAGPLVLNVVVIGEVTSRGPLLRSGALPGDAIVVTGPLGRSIRGQHFDFLPRVREALWLHEYYTLHAGADISDGLSTDLSHLCEESGVAAIVDEHDVPLRNEPGNSLEHALSDGEDFELVLAMPEEEATRLIAAQPLPGVHLSRIGQFTAGSGMQLRALDGVLRPLVPQGFEHKLEG